MSVKLNWVFDLERNFSNIFFWDQTNSIIISKKQGLMMWIYKAPINTNNNKYYK